MIERRKLYIEPIDMQGFGEHLPKPCNDFHYDTTLETYTSGWCTLGGEFTHADFGYPVTIVHIYPEHDQYTHVETVLCDEDVHFYSMCRCHPRYELVDGDATRLMVLHTDMLYDEEPQSQ